MSALLAAQSQSSSGSAAPTSPADALKDLFSQIDADGNGQISKSEFEGALGAGGTNLAQADDVFNKLDRNGDGSVSIGEMSSALKGATARVTITTAMSEAPADRTAQTLRPAPMERIPIRCCRHWPARLPRR